jgi:nicotinate phosphoribosyltransferase
VKIVVSGGFGAARIGLFEREGTPVDACGVGSSLIREANDFTADVVLLDRRLCARTGRRFGPSDRLERVEL